MCRGFDPFFEPLGTKLDLFGVFFLIHQHKNDLLGTNPHKIRSFWPQNTIFPSIFLGPIFSGPRHTPSNFLNSTPQNVSLFHIQCHWCIRRRTSYNTWERGSRTYKKCSTEEHDIRGIKCNSFGNDQLVIGGYSSLMYSNGGCFSVSWRHNASVHRASITEACTNLLKYFE